MILKTQVAIIGAGPTGALLANLLGRRGVACVIIEKQAEPYPLPRAVHFDGETMRVFQSAGLADEVAPLTMVGRGMLFQDRLGETVVDWSRPQEIGLHGWHESYRFHQPQIERVLRQGLDRFAHVSLCAGRAVTAVSQSLQSARLQLDDGQTVTADYVVGCDGAQSFVKSALGMGTEDLGFVEKWLVVDVDLVGNNGNRGDYTIQFCDPDTPATYVRGVGDRRRWEIRLKQGDDGPQTDAETWDRLQGWIRPQDATLVRSAVYTFRSTIAKSWHTDRCFLAGDAAHLMPPFMGQGLCAGVRDVANLAWKLASVLAGGPSEILDSYQTERAPNVREYIDMSVRLGRLINQTAAGQAPKGAMNSIAPSLGPGLGQRDGVAGCHAPQFIDPSGQRSDEIATGGYLVLARTACQTALPVLAGANDWLNKRNLFGVIMRPDGYVLAGFEDEESLISGAVGLRNRGLVWRH